jgi:predicted enzyme related to lactoylglutathione lyase
VKEERMAEKDRLRGLAQINIGADDVAQVRDWYTKVFGIDAYFQQPDSERPAYVEFRVGDDHAYEFGIIDRKFLPPTTPKGSGSTIVRWHVDDIGAAVERLKRLGAKDNEEITERGDGFVTASVVDPFGNVLGLIYSPYYREVLGAARPSELS